MGHVSRNHHSPKCTANSPKMVLLKVNVAKNAGKRYYTRMSQEFSNWLLNGLQPTYKLDVLG